MEEQVVLPFDRSVVSLEGNNADVDVHCLCLSFHSSSLACALEDIYRWNLNTYEHTHFSLSAATPT